MLDPVLRRWCGVRYAVGVQEHMQHADGEDGG